MLTRPALHLDAGGWTQVFLLVSKHIANWVNLSSLLFAFCFRESVLLPFRNLFICVTKAFFFVPGTLTFHNYHTFSVAPNVRLSCRICLCSWRAAGEHATHKILCLPSCWSWPGCGVFGRFPSESIDWRRQSKQGKGDDRKLGRARTSWKTKGRLVCMGRGSDLLSFPASW